MNETMVINKRMIEMFVDDDVSITTRLNDMLHSEDGINVVTVVAAIEAIRQASAVINRFIAVCDPEQLGQIEGVRLWVEIFGEEGEGDKS